AWQIFREHLWFGAGFGNFAGVRFNLQAPAPVELNNDHAHNILSDVSAEFGLAGLLVLVAICWLWWRANRSLPRTIARTFIFVSLALIALYSFVEFPLWLPVFLVPSAVLVAATTPATIHLSVSRGLSRLLAVGALLLPVLTVLIAADYFRTDRA